ncbi:hypothetical protein G9F32_08120 [Acinetobacter sp. 194]|uniref:hypothetical protein n=1 Tax=Acinetobacter shaoyimingii TaxID=2715164 RepID=UPI001407B49E|nr:hypothetical protein [Acinetobacter shaoyimingii]NHB57993.1 hypothetical protein [Acinetobacter shaoyimingii]
MQKNILNSIAIITSCLILNGCTALVWTDAGGPLSMDKAVKTETTQGELLHQDLLLGFVQVQTKNKTNAPQLMIIGQKYAYKIDSGARDALKVIQSMPEHEYWRLKPYEGCDCRLVINLEQNKNDSHALDFSGSIDLYYTKTKLSNDEIEKIRKLGAQSKRIDVGNKTSTTMLVKNIQLKGQVVGLSNELKNIKFEKFSQNYAIDIYAKGSTKKTVNQGLFLKKVALTPFALAADAVFVPLTLF